MQAVKEQQCKGPLRTSAAWRGRPPPRRCSRPGRRKNLVRQPEPDFEEQAGDVVVRFLPSSYHPPLRVSRDLTERQRRILLILAGGTKRSFSEIYQQAPDSPARRTVQADLRALRDLGLVVASGRGVSSRWWRVVEGQ